MSGTFSDSQGHLQTIATGGTGQTTAQAAIDALTDSAGATEGDVLTVDAEGHAVWEAAAGGGGGSGLFDGGSPTPRVDTDPILDFGGVL